MKIDSFEPDILQAAPELRGASFVSLGEGMDNRALLVADRFVFRFPKHAEAAERLQREIALLPKLAPRLEVSIPRIEFVGQQANTGFAFTGHRLIPGIPLLYDLTGPARKRAIGDIAGLLTALRAIPVTEARSWGVADEDPRPGYAEDLELARAQVYPLVAPSVRDYIERLFDTYLADKSLLDYEPSLLHADLAPDHIRYSPEAGRITGVIDWGDASIGDPDYELSYLYRAGGAHFLEEVVQHGPHRDSAKLEKKTAVLRRSRHHRYAPHRHRARRCRAGDGSDCAIEGGRRDLKHRFLSDVVEAAKTPLVANGADGATADAQMVRRWADGARQMMRRWGHPFTH